MGRKFTPLTDNYNRKLKESRAKSEGRGFSSARISGMSRRLDLYHPISPFVRLAVAVVSCGCSSGFGCRSRCRVGLSWSAPCGASRFRASVGWRSASRLCSPGRFFRALLVGFRCGCSSGFGVPSALSGGVPVPLASRLSLPVSCRPPGGVWLRLAPCGRVVSFLRLRRTSLPRNSVGRSADAINAPQGRLQNTEFCIIDPQGVNYTPLPGYKTRILYNCTGSTVDGESASPRLRHPRRGFRSNDSPSG